MTKRIYDRDWSRYSAREGNRLEYIRQRYRVPAKRLGRVRVNGALGTITQATGGYLIVRFDAGHRRRCHPTWRVEYLDPGGVLRLDTWDEPKPWEGIG